MTQLSLFSADLTEPRLEDLGGLLAAHGQVAVGATGTRVSILIGDTWRATALLREMQVRDVQADVSPAPESALHLVRTGWDPGLAAVAQSWTRGAVKAAPAALVIGAGLLRCWTIAAGRPSERGFLLGLDPHAPDTFEPLAAACSRAGIAAAIVGLGAGRPALRVTGRRRTMRLAEMLGTPPPEAPRDDWVAAQ